jgi:membrane-bound metal-dependent hydrolase YbcI (DUF457 family)
VIERHEGGAGAIVAGSCPHPDEQSYAVPALATAAAVRWLPGPWPWLPLAVTAGCWLHLAGDLLTPRGCPLLWPLPWRLEVPLIDIDTSSWRETK